MAKEKEKKKKLITIELEKKWLPTYRLSTGVIAFDKVLGGGLPSGRMAELSGGQSSWKSLVVLQLLANAVKDEKNLVVYADTEHSTEKGLVEMVELDAKKVHYINVDDIYAVEDIFDMLEAGLDVAKDEGKRLVFAWDSIASSPGFEDLVKQLGMPTASARRAKVIKAGLNKYMPRIAKEDACLILVNQLYDKIGVMYGAKEESPGGRSIKFWASVRMKFKNTGTIIDEKSKEQIGGKGNLLIKKNKAGKPFGQVNFEHFELKKLDRYTGLLDYMVRHSEINQAGAWYYFPGSDKKFRSSEFPEKYEEYIKEK